MFNRKLKEQILNLSEQIESIQKQNDILKSQVNNFSSINSILKERLDKAEKELSIANQKLKTEDFNSINSKIDRLNSNLYSLQSQVNKKKSELNEINSNIVENSNKLLIQQHGLFDLPNDSIFYQEKINEVRKDEKELILQKGYYSTISQWTINGNSKKGDRLAYFLSKTCLTSLNLTFDALVDKLSIINYDILKRKITAIFDNYNKTLNKNDLKLSEKYLDLKLKELDYMYKIVIKKNQEKEEQQYQREILKEQLLAEKELQKQKDDLEKKLRELKQKEDEKGIKEVEQKLTENEYKRSHSKAGYVYILSNPALGKNVNKIGITRRTDNLAEERISELSGSNVPFAFKANCLIYTDDCFKLEADLHKEFDAFRVNKVKFHREFFKLPLSQIEKVLKEKYHLNIEMNYDIIDEDFIASGWNLTENYNEKEIK